MADRKNDAYMDIVAILMAALIVLLMFAMTEAGERDTAPRKLLHAVTWQA